VHSYKTLLCNFDVPNLIRHMQNMDAHHEHTQLECKFNTFQDFMSNLIFGYFAWSRRKTLPGQGEKDQNHAQLLK